MKWQTKEGLKELLTHLVEYPSITGSEGEIAIAEYIHLQLSQLDYYKKNSEHLQLHPLEDGRRFLTALIKKPGATKTIVLLSHFDVVPVEDYGGWKNLAFYPDNLTQDYKKHIEQMPPQVQEDLKSGNWLFGRGTMDMKAGLALHMAMIEKAANGCFPGNVLLLTVPDEEANSKGMIGAVPKLVELSETYDLTYQVCLNSEPMFSKYPGDKNYYAYTGSIGKVLPGFYCFGKETHVGEPFAGLNASVMAAEITRELELNTEYCERVDDEVTPPPSNLRLQDLKEEYSVQIPHSAVTIFNILMMKKSLKEITDQLLQSANKAARTIEDSFINHASEFANIEDGYKPGGYDIKVFTFDQLKKIAVERHGVHEVERRQNYLLATAHQKGDRDLSTTLVQDLASLLKDLAPMIVIFYSPPYYPAVSSRNNPIIKEIIQDLQDYSNETYGIEFKSQTYFPGLSDLSFVGINENKDKLNPLFQNMPLFGGRYQLPVSDLQKLNMPVLNIGPLGRDAHQWTERLELNYSFSTLLDLLPRSISKLLSN